MQSQTLVTLTMLYATYLTYKCPCPKTLSCHLNEFFLLTFMSQTLVAYENGLLPVRPT